MKLSDTIDRRRMLIALGGTLSLAGVSMVSNVSALSHLVEGTTPTMPVLFIGHGNPMNAITQNPFATEWEKLGATLPRPRAIVCISAHWETQGTKITAMPKPATIHDFGGFPDQLFAVQYPAPGMPSLVEEVSQQSIHRAITADHEWGLDHGAWSILKRMYPNADIPVVQLSLDVNMSPVQHAALSADLGALRSKGILFVGSGNIVHNLRRVSFDGAEHGWAKEFDAISTDLILKREVKKLAEYHDLGEAARVSIPTSEHYLPMLYALGMVGKKDDIRIFNQQIDLGSVSMTSFIAAQ